MRNAIHLRITPPAYLLEASEELLVPPEDGQGVVDEQDVPGAWVCLYRLPSFY